MEKKEPFDFAALLRKSGCKVTPLRLRLLRLLEKAGSPISAQGIIEKLGRGADQATVYRALKDFKVKGIIRPIDLRHNHAHYEFANLPEHHHLICLRCGRVEDVEECGIREMEQAVLRHARHFTEIHQHSLEFYGVCNACARGSKSRIIH